MNLYHYCSNRAFVSAIQSRSIWLSELSLSNDFLEGKWIRNVLRLACEKRGFAKSDIERILEGIDPLNSVMGGLGYCLSMGRDLLSQWVAYADSATGIAIGFNKEYLEELSGTPRDGQPGFTVQRIIYDENEQISELEEHVDRMEKYLKDGAFRLGGLLSSTEEIENYKKATHSISMSFLLLFQYLYTFKNPAFKEEREWRLLSYRVEKDDDLKYRSNSDRIVPYRILELKKLSTPPIREVLLGPRNKTPVELISNMLEQHGFHDVVVDVSTASYRV